MQFNFALKSVAYILIKACPYIYTLVVLADQKVQMLLQFFAPFVVKFGRYFLEISIAFNWLDYTFNLFTF